MIRRESNSTHPPDVWCLITQIDHAQLAHQLAESWNHSAFKPDSWNQLLHAIRHHDDGWLKWDQHVHFDSDGRPIAFNEMDASDSLEIWRLSIEQSVDAGALAAYCVAKHFLLLADSTPGNEADQFRAQFTRRCNDWKKQIGDDLLCQNAVQALRWFDWLSLYLCMRSAACEITIPEAPIAVSAFEQLVLHPVSNGRAIDAADTKASDFELVDEFSIPTVFSCSSWIWTVQELKLSVDAKLFPKHSASIEADVKLSLQLQPDSSLR